MSALSDLVKDAQAGDMVYKGVGYEHPYAGAEEAAAELAAKDAAIEAARKALMRVQPQVKGALVIQDVERALAALAALEAQKGKS